MTYHVIDFKAIAKWAYYGATKDLHCEKTDRYFAQWEAGASGILTRVMRRIFEQGDSLRDIIVAHDMGHKYRSGIFPEYKKQASKDPENKSPIEVEQLDKLYVWAKQFFGAMGVMQIGVKDVEADDVIAWLRQGLEGPMTIHTVDGDMVALADDETVVYLKDVPHYEEDYKDVPYRLTGLAKSIIGDSSDNYKGIKGAGAGFVQDLIENFGLDGLEDLQSVVEEGNTAELDAAIAETSGKPQKQLMKLRENFADWRLGWKLAQLRPDLCWKPRLKKLTKPTVHKKVPSAAKVFHLLKLVGCEDLWENEDSYATMLPSPMAITSENWEEMKAAIFDEIKKGDITAFDYESSDKNPVAAFRRASPRGDQFVDNLSQVLAGASFQFGRHLENVIYVPVDHYKSPNLPPEVIAEILQFAAEHTQLVVQNAYFEGTVTKTNLGFWLKNVHDTRVMKRFYDENTESGLKFMSLEYLGYEQTSFKDTIASGKKWLEDTGQPATMMCQLTLDEVFTYGTDDSLVTGHLYDYLKVMLQLDGQWEFYRTWAVRPTEALQRAYIDGTNMNWAAQRRKHACDLEVIEEGMKDLRAILLANVSGNITVGAKSLIESEKDYIFRGAKKKAEGNAESASLKLSEWRKKIETACQYTPYREEEIMPEFAFTANQLSAAAEAVGLPPIENISQKGIAAYFESIGAIGFEDGWTLTNHQVQLVKAIMEGMQKGVTKLGDLRKESEHEDEQKAQKGLVRYETALATKERIGSLIQALAGVKPRIVSFGDPLNVGSPMQMQQLLYCKIGVPVRLRGKAPGKGRLSIGITEAGPSTDEKAIETAIANDIEKGSWQHEALKVLLRVKSATTRCSLYHDKYPLWRHRDGRVHSYINDAATDTLRPTANSINVLQVSKKDKEMRSMFIPPNPDYVCVALDFNGQEIRLMANLANDPVMMSVYDPANEKDLHSMTGSGIAKMDYQVFRDALGDEHSEWNKLCNEIRKKAKGVNFGMAYGAGPGTLSRNLIIPVEEAKTLLDDTFNLYTRIRPWQQETAEFMNKNGFTLTAFGTKRHATNDLFSSDNGKVSRQHRQGTNATIQSTAAQMLRIVLTNMVATGMFDRLKFSFFAPIYDEVVSWVHKDDVLQYCQELGKIMEESTPPGHKVRQVPEYSIGPDWGRVHELGRDISPENVAKFVARSLEEAKDIWSIDVLEPFNPISKLTLIEKDEDEEEEVEEVVD